MFSRGGLPERECDHASPKNATKPEIPRTQGTHDECFVLHDSVHICGRSLCDVEVTRAHNFLRVSACEILIEVDVAD